MNRFRFAVMMDIATCGFAGMAITLLFAFPVGLFVRSSIEGVSYTEYGVTQPKSVAIYTIGFVAGIGFWVIGEREK